MTISVFASKIPVAAPKFPVPPKKFPVLLRREFALSPLNHWMKDDLSRGRPKIEKFPVNSPVSREFACGDKFDLECVRHH